MMVGFRAKQSASVAGSADFTIFLGRWTVQRRIFDRMTGSVQHFAGTACIEPDRFSEEGELRTGSGSFVSRRTYRLSRRGKHLSVQFPAGTDFIALNLEDRQTVCHDCGSDLYRGRFFFRNPDNWAEFWRVRGPRKRYVSLAHYLREPPDAGEPPIT